MQSQCAVVLAADSAATTPASAQTAGNTATGATAAPAVTGGGGSAAAVPQTATAPAADTSTKDSNVPDFLKEYDQKPSSTTTPPTTTTTTTTSIVPKPPAPVAVPAASAAAAALNQTPKAQPANAPMLKGRLEEISGSGASLPVGLLLNLKAQKGKVDPATNKPQVNKLQGLVASFPTDWAGDWGGQIKIHWTQLDKAFYDFDAAEAKETAQILRPGSTGTTTFTFYRTGKDILLQPARIAFPPRTNQYTANQLQSQMRNSPFGSLMGANNPMMGQMLSTLATGVPVLCLGDITGVGVTGNSLNSRVVKNVIKQLKPGVLEQNIVVQEAERQARTNEVRNSFSESVLRFTKINPNQLYVQAASLKYRKDGHLLEKVLMYGTVNKGQNMGDPSGMGGMMGFPGMPGMPGAGALPGGSSSPGSGFGALDEMLKQLQGF